MRRTIALVEDDLLVRKVIRRAMERAGYRVIALDGPSEAIERLRVDGPRVDLLLTDVRMPGMSGADLAREVRAIRPELPIAFVSGCVDREPGDPSSELRPLLAKPFTGSELLDFIEGVLRERGPEGALPP